jgi:hypothetical protein
MLKHLFFPSSVSYSLDLSLFAVRFTFFRIEQASEKLKKHKSEGLLEAIRYAKTNTTDQQEQVSIHDSYERFPSVDASGLSTERDVTVN